MIIFLIKFGIKLAEKIGYLMLTQNIIISSFFNSCVVSDRFIYLFISDLRNGKMDYCHPLLAEGPKSSLKSFQRFPNSASRQLTFQ